MSYEPHGDESEEDSDEGVDQGQGPDESVADFANVRLEPASDSGDSKSETKKERLVDIESRKCYEYLLRFGFSHSYIIDNRKY